MHHGIRVHPPHPVQAVAVPALQAAAVRVLQAALHPDHLNHRALRQPPLLLQHHRQVFQEPLQLCLLRPEPVLAPLQPVPWASAVPEASWLRRF